MFEPNPELTIWNGLLFTIVGGLFLFAVLRWARIVWRSSPQEFNDYQQTLRPKSWRRWYVVNYFWHDQDRHPTRVLWESRISTVVGILMAVTVISIGLWVIATNVLR